MMSCKHNTIQVVLNPSSGCVVTKSSTSSNGDVLANICAQCSVLKVNENTFDNPKPYHRSKVPCKFIVPITRESQRWLSTSAFGKVSSVSADGITIFTQDASVEVPTGTIWYYKTKEEVITVGRAYKQQPDRLPVHVAMVAIASMLAETEKMERMEETEIIEEVEKVEKLEETERLEEMEKLEEMERLEEMEMPRVKREKMEN